MKIEKENPNWLVLFFALSVVIASEVIPEFRRSTHFVAALFFVMLAFWLAVPKYLIELKDDSLIVGRFFKKRRVLPVSSISKVTLFGEERLVIEIDAKEEIRVPIFISYYKRGSMAIIESLLKVVEEKNPGCKFVRK